VEVPAQTRRLEGERRTVTVVMSDLSGYTALGERLDPEDVAQIMTEIKSDATRIVESFGGIVNQFVGDEVVSLFGLPNAKGDDARRAVSAAIELHARVAELSERGTSAPTPLSMHSGIQTGLLVAELREARSGLYELTGDTINTAARLLSIAGSGEIVVGEATRQAVAPYFEIEPFGTHQVRGKADPLASFRIVRPWVNRSRFDASKARGLTRLTGRREEIGRLEAVLGHVEEGNGRIVVVEGEAGAGKSRLCHDFLAGLASTESGVGALSGRCQAYGTVTSYLPFIQVLREAFGLGEEDSSDEVAEKMDRTLSRLGPALASRRSVYLHLLSAAAISDLPAQWQGDELPGALQNAIVDLVLAISEATTTVVSLDDWHWADEASRTTLLRLSRALEGQAVMVLVTSRPSPRLWDNIETERLALGLLSTSDTSEMIARCFEAQSVQPALAERIYHHTMGNPLFVEEVCSALRQRNDVSFVEGEVLYSGDVGRFDFPATVQSVVLGRVDSLPPQTRQLLRFASVMGREFNSAVLSRVMDSQLSIDDGLQELERLSFVERLPGSSNGHLQFKHVIIQEVTYGTLLMKERAAVHARIAELIESGGNDQTDQSRHLEELAHHYRLAGNAPKALQYLEQAGRKALARFAFADARQHLRLAIEQSLTLEDSLEMRQRRAALALMWASSCIFGPSASQIDLLEIAHREAVERDDHAVARMCRYWISWIHYAIGNQFMAEAETRQLIEMTQHYDDGDTSGRLRGHLGQILVVQRRLDEAERELQAGLRQRELAARARSRGSARPYPFAVLQLALAAADRGDFAVAHDDVERAIDSMRGSGERTTEAALLVCCAMAFGFEGDWVRMGDDAAGIRASAEYVGAPFHLACADVFEGYANFQLGARSLGLRLMRRGLVAHEQSGALLTLCLTRSYVADALAREGDIEEATTLAYSALSRADVGDCLGDDIARRVLLRCEARLAPDLLASEIERNRTIAIERRSRREEALLELAAAEAYVAIGDGPAARRHGDASVEAIGQLGMAWWLKQAESVRSIAARL
jgi:class 3 adenylate cyclase/tetratricopeptide (TPR) repeat protein